MKTNFLLVALTALAATAIANPVAETENDLVGRQDMCRKASSCSMSWAGKCEDYCKPYKFSHMTGDGCGAFSKRCCCDSSEA